MNTLSWFVYLAEIIPALGHFVGVFGAIGFIIIGSIALFSFALKLNEEEISFNPPSKTIFVVAVVCSLLSIITPSKETIYLIAGSEAGEYVVNTPEGQEIVDDIHKVIKHQLKELQGETNGK